MSAKPQDDVRPDGDAFTRARDRSISEWLETQLGVTSRKVSGSLRLPSCPACGPGSKASVRLSISKDDRYAYCFACGFEGSIIDAHMAVHGGTPADAVRDLLNGDVRQGDGSVQAAYKAQREKRLAEEVAEAERMSSVRRKAFCLIHQACRDFREEDAPLRYLTDQRRIPLELVREAQTRGMLGFLPADHRRATDVLVRIVGEDLLRESGLWKPDKKLPGIAHRPLVFFMPGMTSAEFRLIDKEIPEGWAKSIRYGTTSRPYWWNGSQPQCLVVEGMIDLLSAVALGFKGHIMGLPGITNYQKEWFAAAAKRYGLKRYVIAFDNDEVNAQGHQPGQEAAAKLKAFLDTQGLPSFVKTPQFGDINDVLRARVAAG